MQKRAFHKVGSENVQSTGQRVSYMRAIVGVWVMMAVFAVTVIWGVSAIDLTDIGSSADSIAGGGVNLVNRGASSIFQNPAVIDHRLNWSLDFFQTQPVDDIYVQSLSASRSYLNYSVGVGYLGTSASDIENTSDTLNAQNGEIQSLNTVHNYQYGTYYLSGKKDFLNGFSGGLSLKYTQLNLAQIKGAGINSDLSMIWEKSGNIISVGANNILTGNKLKYKDNENTVYQSETYPLKLFVSGATYFRFNQVIARIFAQVQKNTLKGNEVGEIFSPTLVSFGTRLKYLKIPYIELMLGYRTVPYLNQTKARQSMGINLKSGGLQLSYAYERSNTPVFDNHHYISLSLNSWKKKNKRPTLRHYVHLTESDIDVRLEFNEKVREVQAQLGVERINVTRQTNSIRRLLSDQQPARDNADEWRIQTRRPDALHDNSPIQNQPTPLYVYAKDIAGNMVDAYTIPLLMTIASPQNNDVIYNQTVDISGEFADHVAFVTHGTTPIYVNNDQTVNLSVPLTPGANEIPLTITFKEDPRNPVSSDQLQTTQILQLRYLKAIPGLNLTQPTDYRSVIVLTMMAQLAYPNLDDFNLNLPLTRDAFSQLLVKLSGVGYTPTVSSDIFSDVKATSPYAPYIRAAIQAGLILAKPDATFQPKGAVTKGEFITAINAIENTRYNAPAEIKNTPITFREASIFIAGINAFSSRIDAMMDHSKHDTRVAAMPVNHLDPDMGTLKINLPDEIRVTRKQSALSVSGRTDQVSQLEVNGQPLYIRRDGQFYTVISIPKTREFNIQFTAKTTNGDTITHEIKGINEWMGR